MKRWIVVWFDPVDGLEFSKGYKDPVEAEGRASHTSGKVIEVEIDQ